MPMMRKGRRRRRNGFFLLDQLFADSRSQYFTTIISALLFAALIFSGFLLFRFNDEEDLLQRGKDLMAEGKVAWAAQTFQRLVNKYNGSYEGHLRLGQAYLEMGERRKASQQFEMAAAIREQGNVDGKVGAAIDIARSKLDLAKKDFKAAEKKLLKAQEADGEASDVKEALLELYEYWGDTLIAEKETLDAIEKYEQALHYVEDVDNEQALKTKLVDLIQKEAMAKAEANEYETAIELLKKSVRLKYLPETLVNIADFYERTKNMDDAIIWYRKAFDANPSLISLKLYNMLMDKGRELKAKKKNEEAEKFFAEAESISKKGKIPPDVLYPVTVSDVRFVDINPDFFTGQFTPKVSFKVANDSDKDLNFLAARATFLSQGKKIAETDTIVASPDKTLAGKESKDKKANSRTITLKGGDRLSIRLLKQGELRARIEVAYSQGTQAKWVPKALHEVILRKPAPAEESSASDTVEATMDAGGTAIPLPPPPPSQ